MSVPFAILRHAPTGWNAEGRLQGSTDIPLSPAGEAAARSWRLPAPGRWLATDVQPVAAGAAHGRAGAAPGAGRRRIRGCAR